MRERVLLEQRLDKQAYEQFLMDNELDAHQYPMSRFIREHPRRRVNSDVQSDDQAPDANPRADSQQSDQHTVENHDQNHADADGPRAETPVVIRPEDAPLAARHTAVTPGSVNPVLQQAYGNNETQRLLDVQNQYLRSRVDRGHVENVPRRGLFTRVQRTRDVGGSTQLDPPGQQTTTWSQLDRQALTHVAQRTEEAMFAIASVRSQVDELQKDALTSRDARQLEDEIGLLRTEMQRMSGRLQLLEEL